MPLVNPVQFSLNSRLGLYSYFPVSADIPVPTILRIDQTPGRIIIIGRAQNTSSTGANTVYLDSYEALYEIPCSSLAISAAGVISAQIPSYINISSPMIFVLLALTSVGTDAVLKLLPTNI